jgi:hypothetical protein
MADHDLYNACNNYRAAYVHDPAAHHLRHVRAVYDAAAHILDIHPDHADDDVAAVWQLRAAYIDTHAALTALDGDAPQLRIAWGAARDALVAATAGHTVT